MMCPFFLLYVLLKKKSKSNNYLFDYLAKVIKYFNNCQSSFNKAGTKILFR